MSRPPRTHQNLILSFLIAILFAASPALAQEPTTQPPPQAAPEAPKPKDPKDQSPQDPTVGKSKLEKETGTVNDRIFEVLPNYGTVENAQNLPPLTTGQKFRLATAGVFDWGSYPFNGILAAISQAKNEPKEYGQGWDAYSKRYAVSFADNSIATYMTTAIFPSLLHEDPPLLPIGKGPLCSPRLPCPEPPLHHPHGFRPRPFQLF